MASRYQPFSLPELRGLDEGENPHALAPTSLTVADNVWRLGRSIGTRPGRIRDPDNDYDAAIATGPTICGIADFRRARNSARTLVVVVPGAIHTDDTTTLTPLGAGVTITNAAELPWTFAQHKNKLFAAGGDVSAADTAWYWDGAGSVTRLGILNNAGANIEPRYIHSFGNRLFAAGFSGSDPSGNPGVVRYSALNDGTVWPTENTLGGNNSVGGFAADDEEYVTGLSSYQNDQGRWLLVMTNRRLYSMQESINPAQIFLKVDETAIGCVGQSAYVNLGVDAGDAVFMSDAGVHSLMETNREGNNKRRYLSWMIRKTFATLNRARSAYVVSAPWVEHGLAVFAVATGSNTENDLLLVLDMKESGDDLSADSSIWFKWTPATNISYLAAGRTEAGVPSLYWGDYSGNVGTFTTDNYSDLSTAYTAAARTKYTDFNAATATKTLGDVYVDVGRPASSTAYAVRLRPLFDFGQVPGETFALPLAEADQFVLDVSFLDVGVLGGEDAIYHFKLYMNGHCYTCAFDFWHSGNNEPFYIHRIAGEVSVSGESSEGEAAA